jgi:Spy/CpxP family protein refolding chaperone
MRRRSVTLSAVLTFVSVLAIAGLAPAQGPPGGGRGGPMGPMGGMMGGMGALSPMMLQRLGLSDEQWTQIRALLEKSQTANRPATERLRDLEKQLNAAIFSDASAASTQGTVLTSIDDLKTQIGTAQAEALAAQVAVEQQVAQILTAEQRQSLLRMLSGVPPARGQGPGPGGGPPPPSMD